VAVVAVGDVLDTHKVLPCAVVVGNGRRVERGQNTVGTPWVDHDRNKGAWVAQVQTAVATVGARLVLHFLVGKGVRE